MSLALVVLTVAAFVAMNYPYRGSKAVLLAASIIHAGGLIGGGIIFMRYLTDRVL